MTNKIQIKRSTAATGPGTVLHAGELAYSYVSNKLFVGNSGGVGNPAHIIFGGNTGDINFVGVTAGAGLTGTKITPTGDHTQTLAIDKTASIHMGGISCDGGFTLASGASVSGIQTNDLDDVTVSFTGNYQLLSYSVGDGGFVNTGRTAWLAPVTVSSFNGSTGAVTGVSSFNGSTGAVTGVSSFNGSTGAVTFTSNVTSFNGLTGAVNVSASQTVIGGVTLGSKGATFGGSVIAPTFVGAVTGNVTGNASGSAATVTAAAQTAITSVGTLTSLQTSGGMTLGGNLVFGGNHHIRNSANNTLIDFEGDANFMLGDVDSAHNDTTLHIRDSHSSINMIAAGQIRLDSPVVYVSDKITHYGDTNTYLNFQTDQITLQAGGTDYIDITSAGTNFADTAVVRPKLKDYSETVNAIGTITDDCTVALEDGNVQTVTVSDSALEFDFDNWPATGIAGTVTLIITNGGSQTVTWESAVKWPGDNAPALTSSGVDVVSFMSIDAGTTVYGFVGGINFS
jgi:hypothetical protein